MTGQKLRIALERTGRQQEHTIQVIDRHRAISWLTAAQAFELVATFPDGHWVGSGSNRNIKTIEFKAPKPVERPVVIRDSGFGLLRYPMPSMGSLSNPFPALARQGAGL